jgi:ABC-type enterobactin transport system permease subunit
VFHGPKYQPPAREAFQSFYDNCVGDDDVSHEAAGGFASEAGVSPERTNMQVRWFKSWLGLFATFAGTAVGITGAAASFYFSWFNAGGFFVRRPLCLYLPGGYFNVGALGAAGIASIGTAVAVGAAAGVVASAAVYYIPWRKIYEYMQSVLAGIWNKIRRYISKIWAKVTEFVSDATNALAQGVTENLFPHMRKPMRVTV